MALYDRGYMRGSSPGEQALSGMGMIMVLIAINVVLFLAGNILPGLAEMLLLTPQGIRSGRIYQLVTAGFLQLAFGGGIARRFRGGVRGDGGGGTA